ncbi:polysaccharide biosynthesis/export family protein [Hydrogenophaga sp. BPS33]|uniref:polysaccharide biosynthesis/export family protein n=1 Tax=Hydrogenophaga sp. BPS33 TaxID=2651974 RepID=UPI0013203143|nr:polysaccharide biosynthesis/export family protein [Hydrogenophaga sp. BPS33]QHE88549.1 polysaccharide export protein [Hydrogenophaga sp. BPS33]
MTQTQLTDATRHTIAAIALLLAIPVQAQTTDTGAIAQPVVARSASSVESMGAPLAAPNTAGADYKITANDLMEFDVFGVPDMKRDVRVNASGEISLPLIGQVPVAGLTAQAAEDRIAAKYKEKYLQDPQVSLFIKEFTTQRVAIEGAVLRPGIYPMTGQLTLLRALALSGGFAPYADLKQIVVYRNEAGGQREQTTYDLDKVRSGAVPDPSIRSDDVIVVQRDGRRTALRDSLFRDVLDTLNPFK